MIESLGCAAAIALLLASPGTVSEPGQPHRIQDSFPVPEKPLVVSVAHDASLTLFDILRTVTHDTGQNFLMDGQTNDLLRQIPVILTGPVEVPPTDVFTFVEGLLDHHGFAVATLQTGAVRTLGVYHSRSRQGLSGRVYEDVPFVSLEHYQKHPALLIQTVFDIEPLDARMTLTSLRGLMENSSITAFAAGSHSLVLRGTGRAVADAISLLRVCQETARSYGMQIPPKGEAGKGAGADQADKKDG